MKLLPETIGDAPVVSPGTVTIVEGSDDDSQVRVRRLNDRLGVDGDTNVMISLGQNVSRQHVLKGGIHRFGDTGGPLGNW